MAARILIIEDNPTNLELMVYLFRAFGYAPLTARDGQEGLEAITREAPDLIICDLEMPGVDGYHVGRQVKSRSCLPKVPVVAVTALAMVGDRDKVLAAGFDGYIPKPISPESFVRQIEAFLPPEQRSSQRREAHASPGETAPPPPRRATILAVGHSAINLSLIRSTLEPFGYEVIAVQRPEEAAELARRHSPDLILSDLQMPGESGLELLRQVKAEPALRAIPFLLFSASTSGRTEQERALALGADGFLLQPIEPQALVSFVEACLQKASRN